MKYVLAVLISILIVSFATMANAQTIVSTEPMNRTLVLEFFTGIMNYNSPIADRNIRLLHKQYPEQLITIGIHEGYYAKPETGSQPDYRTVFGTAIAELLDARIISGSFNRAKSPNIEATDRYPGIAVPTDYWDISAAEVVTEKSPVNIAVEAKWIDKETIEIKVEAYFTDDCQAGSLLNIAFLENGVVGYQRGPYDNPEYVHNYILRDLVTGQWGEEMLKGNKDDYYEKTFIYKPDKKCDIYNDEFDIVAFITKGSHEYIYTGTRSKVVVLYETEMNPNGKTIMSCLEGQGKILEITLTNDFDHEVSYTLSIEKSESTPTDWIVEIIEPDEELIRLSSGQSTQIKFVANPGATRGYSIVNVIAQEKDTKYNFAIKQEFGIISDEYKQLMINTGKDNETIPAAVAQSNSPYYGITSISGDVFEMFVNEFTNLNTILWDNGTKGVFSPGHARAVKTVIDKGCDIALLGAMTAFELDDEGVLPSLGLEDKGVSLMGYDYISIGVYDYYITGIVGDPISKGMGGNIISCLQNVLIPIFTITNKETTTEFIRFVENGAYRHNGQIDLINSVDALFAFRIEKGKQKIVYMSESPSVFIDEEKSAELTVRILDYLSDFVSVEEFAAYFSNMTAAPNPFAASTTVEFNMTSAAVADMSIVDAAGNLVKDLGSKTLAQGQNIQTINSDNLASGLYFFVVKTASQTQQIKLVISK